MVIIACMFNEQSACLCEFVWSLENMNIIIQTKWRYLADALHWKY